MRVSLRLFVFAATVGLLFAATALPASATHTHAKATGQDGVCVLLAADAGEEDVVLPTAVFTSNPNVTTSPTAGRNHPLHVLAHKGVPGADGGYWVHGAESDQFCSSYLND